MLRIKFIHLRYIKNYLLNIIILSKCLDFVSSKGSGATGVFILTNGFRHIKIYDLGLYKRLSKEQQSNKTKKY